MHTLRFLLPLGLLGAAIPAQAVAVFPGNYATVAEGPLNSPNVPLANGTSRTQIVYEAVDLPIPSGHVITQLGFRQDASVTTLNPGRSLQLEVRMGWTTSNAATLGYTFDTNYVATPTTVFGPALYVLPNLRDPANPLPNGQFFITLTSPFSYVPNGRNLVVEYRVLGTNQGGAPFTYYLDRADYVSPVTYGPAGCAHSTAQIPTLTADPTRPGLGYSTVCTGAPAQSFGFLMVSPGGSLMTPFSLQSMVPGISASCTGQIPLTGLLTLSGVTGASGYGSWYWTIPNNAAFNGFSWASQAAFLDFFSPGGVVVSNGAQVVTGTLPRTSMLYAVGPPASTATGSLAVNYAPVAFFRHQ